MYIFQIKFSSKPVEYNIPNKSCIYAKKIKIVNWEMLILNKYNDMVTPCSRPSNKVIWFWLWYIPWFLKCMLDIVEMTANECFFGYKNKKAYLTL